MKPEQYTDEELAGEIKRQTDIKKATKPGSQAHVAADRILHHLASEQARRQRASVKP
jgi:hypothetical protein